MLFNSLEFAIFLPLVFLLYWFVFDYAMKRTSHQLLLKTFCTLSLCLLFNHVHGMDVVFRLDDPSLEKSNFTKRVTTLFAEKNIPLSIAVVTCDNMEKPICDIDTQLVRLLSNGQFEICLHGMNHVSHNGHGEFSGIGQQEARRRISLALNHLESIFPNKIKTFIPPHNAIDDNSIIELKNNFSIISSDMFTKAFTDDIDYYPETLGHLMDDYSVWEAAQMVLNEKYEKNAICVIMFHHYDLESEEDWNALTSLLDFCNNDKQITLHTFSSLRDSGNLSSCKRLKANQLDSGLKKLVLTEGVLHSTALCYFVHIANATLYALLVLLSMIVLIVLNRPITFSIKAAYVITASIAFIAAYFHLLGPLKLCFVAIVISSALLLIAIKRGTHVQNL